MVKLLDMVNGHSYLVSEHLIPSVEAILSDLLVGVVSAFVQPE